MTRGTDLQQLIDRYHYTEEIIPGSARYQLKPALLSLPSTLLMAVDNVINANVAVEDVRVPVSSVLGDTIISLMSNLDGESIDSIDHEHHDLWTGVLTAMFAQELQVEIEYNTSVSPKVANTFVIRPL